MPLCNWKVSLYLVFLLVSSALQIPVKQNVWTTFGDLAVKTGACNLGQGYPDWDTPDFVLESLHKATKHQYTRPSGYPDLASLLSTRYFTHLNHEVNPMSEIAITVGASQALYLALATMLKEGDEVVMFDPYFELYAKQIALTKATPVFVQLGGRSATTQNPWALDIETLKRAITSKTKVIILNSPHNPTGKVFTLSELQSIAAVVRDHPHVSVISDEVYKYTIYNPQEEGDGQGSPRGHHHFARLAGMWDRTLTISSAGKTFSVTGWQVGWMVGPEKFVGPVQQILPCVQFCTPTPIQEALCSAIIQADQPYMGYPTYYEWLRQQFAHKRAILEQGLRAGGIEPMTSEGGFFLMGQLPVLDLHSRSQTSSPSPLTATHIAKSTEPYDWQYCRYLGERHGVIGIPAGPFFSRDDYSAHYFLPPLARFAFCKRDDTLVEAARRLSAGPMDYTAAQSG